MLAALRGKLSHDDLAVYNAVQRLLYLGVILAGVVIVLSGLSIWKPVQFKYLTAFFGGYDIARYVHFFAMSSIVGVSGRPYRAGAAGAEKPARDDRRPLKGGQTMSRTRKPVPGVDPKLLIKDAAKLLPRAVAADVPARRRRASARSRC